MLSRSSEDTSDSTQLHETPSPSSGAKGSHPLLVGVHEADAEVVLLQQVQVVAEKVKQVLALSISLQDKEAHWQSAGRWQQREELGHARQMKGPILMVTPRLLQIHQLPWCFISNIFCSEIILHPTQEAARSRTPEHTSPIPVQRPVARVRAECWGCPGLGRRRQQRPKTTFAWTTNLWQHFVGEAAWTECVVRVGQQNCSRCRHGLNTTKQNMRGVLRA